MFIFSVCVLPCGLVTPAFFVFAQSTNKIMLLLLWPFVQEYHWC
jgi:hypothetical protein